MNNRFKKARVLVAVLSNLNYFSLLIAAVICLAIFAGIRAVNAVGPTMAPPNGGSIPSFSNMWVSGSIKNNGANKLRLDDQVEITGQLDVTGNIITNTGSIYGAFGSFNALSSTNPTFVNGIDIKDGGLRSTSGRVQMTDADGMIITDPSEVTKEGAGAFRIGSLGSPSWLAMDNDEISMFSVSSEDDLTLQGSGSTGDVIIGNDLHVNGNLIVDGTFPSPSAPTEYPNLTVTTKLDLKGDLEDSVDGIVNVNDDLTVSGHVKAASIGSYHITASTDFVNLPQYAVKTQTASCSTDEFLISCGFQFYDSEPAAVQGQFVKYPTSSKFNFSHNLTSVPSDRTCKGDFSVWETLTYPRFIKVEALCFDPAG